MSETQITNIKLLPKSPSQSGDHSPLLDVTGTRTESSPIPGAEGVIKTRGANALAPAIDIDRLYEAPAGTTSQMVRALELLKQAIQFLADAQKSKTTLEADRLVQRVQSLLPKLFSCRSIGDGFGVIVNALDFAFVNLRGTPLTARQLNAVWRVLRELRHHPAMTLEQGIQRVEEFEEEDLEVDPPQLAELLEHSESAENE